MIVANGFIRKDLMDASKVVQGKKGTYMDIECRVSLKGNRPKVEIYQQSTKKMIGWGHPGYQTEPLNEGIHGQCEINIDKIEWDQGVWTEGHLTVVFRDKPNQHGNTMLIHTDQPHRSMDYLKVTLGSGKRNDIKLKK